MVCIGSLRALLLRAAGVGGRRWPRVLCGGRAAAVDARVLTPRALVRGQQHGWRGLQAAAGTGARMMLDSSSDSAAAGQVQPQRRAAGAVAHAQDGGAGGFASGGWASCPVLVANGHEEACYGNLKTQMQQMFLFAPVQICETVNA
ncbi:hypothetical protein E2562_025516 [Oryza meyeriana var. granulata]|uniref:Uncharacterized protein n=1 Tax=Oryza meyeriana var. granulata TaxID=110450 RepID=A0A6G1FC16_9ORYZ|nr:hypothetical protein E2562_025516 [Oryza meyeriana var. granulata]